MDAETAVRAARSLIGEATPLRFDCGLICGYACCKEGEQGEGMLLFPGEEKLYSSLPEGFSLSPLPQTPGVSLLACGGRCDRADRPLACRFFPLVPLAKREKDGTVRLHLALDRRAWPVCPLMEDGFRALAPGFLEGCKKAARALFESEEQRAFLLGLSDMIAQYKLSLWEEDAR